MTALDNWSARWSGLKVRTQVGLAFALLIALGVVLGGVALVSLKRVNDASADFAARWLPGVSEVARARSAMLDVSEFLHKLANASDASYADEYREKLGAALAATEGHLKAHAALPQSADESAALAQLDKQWAAFRQIESKIEQSVKAGQMDDARDVADGAGKMSLEEAIGTLDALRDAKFKGAEATAAQADQVEHRARLVLLGLLGLSVVLGVGLTALFARSLGRQLGGEPVEAIRVAQAVAQGDLSTAIALRAGDSRSLMAILATMQQNLAQVVQQVRQGSDQVATASEQIAHGNADLSNRTEQQASALQQTAASMHELGETVDQNSENARLADELARGASEVAARGGSAVAEVVTTMREIDASSKKIAEITGVIDGIAFQTNILALNAAVEAARAGEQGRGFAVVAGEVRTLAQRSAEAAREIKRLIAASVERVEAGTRQVDAAGSTIGEVVQQVERVTQLMGQISTASAEQRDGVRQVGDAVSQMDQTTQQNAALVEESAAAAESLRQQARQLVESVAVFRV